MIVFKHTGNFSRTEKFFNAAASRREFNILNKYAQEGVSALAQATPKDTGETANCWDYEVKISRTGYTITWTNSSENNGVPIVILLQYGHGTRGGTYVAGRDFINPVMRPIFDKIAENLWEEVVKS